MPTLTLHLAATRHTLAFSPGESLRDILDQADQRVRTACLGHGACGLCRVRLLGAVESHPSAAERLHIPAQELAEGVRLACQQRPDADLELELLAPAPPSHWHSTSLGRAATTSAPPFSGDLHHPLAVAVDVGTSNLRLALLDLRHGRWLAECRGANPQAGSGADVLSRLTLASASPEQAAQLSATLVQAIGEALAELTGRQGIDPARIARIALVGNSAILTLLSGDRVARLLDPDNWLRPLACTTPPLGPWRTAWSLHPEAEVELVQPLAGFVGSDLLAGVLATALLRGPAPALLVDLGTNSEVALWDGATLWVTSAAGGPAFEVSGYSSGMPAEAGAIHRVRLDAAGEAHYEVVGGGVAQGICGSGVVDLVAELRRVGRLNPIGRFRSTDHYPLETGEGATLSLTHRDVDNLQQAKAGIASAIQILAQQSGVALGQLARVVVAGEFGRFLGVQAATAIGLLPGVPPERIELCADAPLLGCAALLLDAQLAAELAQLRALTRMVNLALEPEFEQRFIDNLWLRPMGT